MNPLKIAIPLLSLVVIALAVRPFITVKTETLSAITADALLAEKSGASSAEANAPQVVPYNGDEDSPDGSVEIMVGEPQPPIIDPQVTALLAIFNDPKNAGTDERLLAIMDLTKADQNDPRIQAFLIVGLNNPDDDTRLVMLETIRDIGDPAYIPALRSALARIKDADTRQETQELIEFMEAPANDSELIDDAPPAP